MTAMNPFFEQNHFRVRSDTTAADPGTPVWETTEDQAAALSWNVDTTYRIRFVVSNSGDANGVNDFQLYVSKNSGAYSAVTTNSTNGAQSADASSSADGTTLTTANFQLSAGTGTAADGMYDEDGTIVSNLSKGDYLEFEFGITIPAADVSDTDTLDFRVYYNNAPFDQYDVTPRISVNESVTHTVAGETASSAAAVDQGALTQEHDLAGDISASPPSADSVSLTQAHSLTGTDVGAASTIDQAVVTESNTVAGTDSAAITSVASAALTQVHTVTGTVIASAPTSVAPTITQAHTLTASDITSAVTVDLPVVDESNIVTGDVAAAATTLDQMLMTQAHDLAIANVAAIVTVSQTTIFDPGEDESSASATWSRHIGKSQRQLAHTIGGHFSLRKRSYKGTR